MSMSIPQPPGLPYLGNIFDIDPNNAWVSVQRLWQRYGEIFKITVLGQQIVFVGSVALCEELCDEKRFRKYVGGPTAEIRRALHGSLLTAYDLEPSWPIHHRLLAPWLTAEAVAGHLSSIRDCAAELVKKWQAQGHNVRVPLMSDLNRLNLETTTRCFYGRKLDGVTGTEHKMVKSMEGATSEAFKRLVRPYFLNWLFFQSKFDRDIDTMRKYALDCLKYRNTHSSDRKDMLGAMMDAQDSETGQSLHEEEIIDEIVAMLIGSSTSPCVIASAIYYLLENPVCLTNAQREIDAVVGSTSLEHEHLKRLPYCAGVVREAMRLSASAPGFIIEPIPGTPDPVLLGRGRYAVPANQTMVIILHGVNRDPSVFHEPDAFRPERMVGAAFDRLPAGAQKWFGSGKRACIDLEKADPAYRLKQDGWFTLRPFGFFVKARQRSDYV